MRERQVDIRLIAASHEHLVSLVEAKRFRGDLYFRINTVILEIPPLRQRPEDLPALAESFSEEIAAELGRAPLRLSAPAADKLREYAWPGNIRELRNMLERAALLTSHSEIGADELGIEAAVPTPADGRGLTLLDTEKQLIRRALETERGRVDRAALALGISRSSLYQKIRKYGIALSRN